MLWVIHKAAVRAGRAARARGTWGEAQKPLPTVVPTLRQQARGNICQGVGADAPGEQCYFFYLPGGGEEAGPASLPGVGRIYWKEGARGKVP